MIHANIRSMQVLQHDLTCMLLFLHILVVFPLFVQSLPHSFIFILNFHYNAFRFPHHLKITGQMHRAETLLRSLMKPVIMANTKE